MKIEPIDVDAEDLTILISFIDYALDQMVIENDDEARSLVLTVFHTREALHKALGPLGTAVPPGKKPC